MLALASQQPFYGFKFKGKSYDRGSPPTSPMRWEGLRGERLSRGCLTTESEKPATSGSQS
jgi:hypothetical protein